MSDHFRHLNAVRKSRNTFRLGWRRTSLSKASQRTRTPSRRKVDVSSAEMDLRSFSYLRLVPKDILPPLVKWICRLRRLEGHDKDRSYKTAQTTLYMNEFTSFEDADFTNFTL